MTLLFFTDCELNVITNNKKYIEKISNKLKCIEIEFIFKVPKGIGFYSAHYKVDVFNFLSRQIDCQYSFLLDSDMICINKLPLNLINCISDNIPVYYDITDQVYPRYGREVIIKDKELLTPGSLSEGLWAGGEFIGGDCHFFRMLSDEINIISSRYLDEYKILHHQGDEMLTSVAIERLKKRAYISDAGKYGGVRRYWSDQIRRSFYYIKHYPDDFLIHLPADKGFIINTGRIGNGLIKRYAKYLFKISLVVFAKKIIKKIISKI